MLDKHVWWRFNNWTNSGYWLGWVVDGFANNGTTGAIRNEIWTTGANDWVISPVINIQLLDTS